MKNELGVKSIKGNENNIATLALRKFLERCRKKTGKSLKHWCVTELGEDRGRIFEYVQNDKRIEGSDRKNKIKIKK